MRDKTLQPRTLTSAHNETRPSSRKTSMSLNCTHREFYDLLWLEPMISLAEKFGISYAKLNKVCRKQQIPDPPLDGGQRKERSEPTVRNRSTCQSPSTTLAHCNEGACAFCVDGRGYGQNEEHHKKQKGIQ